MTAVGTAPFRIEQYDKVLAQLGEETANKERYVGTDNDGKLRIVGVWESKEHADRFFAERLGPMLAKALDPDRSAGRRSSASTLHTATSASRWPEAPQPGDLTPATSSPAPRRVQMATEPEYRARCGGGGEPARSEPGRTARRRARLPEATHDAAVVPSHR